MAEVKNNSSINITRTDLANKETVNLGNKLFNGYIYSMSLDVGFDGNPSSLVLNLALNKTIKEALMEIKTNIKVSMRSKWYLSEQPTLQLALMKLISSEEELRKLSMSHNVLEEKEKPIFNGIDINVAEDNGPGQD